MDDSDNDPRDMGKEFERRRLTKGGESGGGEEEGATGVDFIKLHVPPKTLKKYAEILKMRMPLRVGKFSFLQNYTRFIVEVCEEASKGKVPVTHAQKSNLEIGQILVTG